MNALSGPTLTLVQIFLFAAWLIGVMFTVSAILVATYGKADRNMWNVPPPQCTLNAAARAFKARHHRS